MGIAQWRSRSSAMILRRHGVLGEDAEPRTCFFLAPIDFPPAGVVRSLTGTDHHRRVAGRPRLGIVLHHFYFPVSTR